jgi:hypothetical protein
MEGMSLWHWLIVIFLMLVWSNPLSVICRRAGKPAAIGWLAGTVGLLVAGPFSCIWWLALTSWNEFSSPK